MEQGSGNLTQARSFDLSDLVFFLWSHKFRIAFLAVLMLVPITYWVMQLPKVYVATSTLLLDRSAGVSSLPSLMPLSEGGGDDMETNMQFLRSRTFAGLVVDTLDLPQYKEYQHAKFTGSEARVYAINHFLRNVNYAPVPKTEMLKVQFSSTSPELAALIANTVGPEFFRFYNELVQQKVTEASERLNAQLDDVTERLAESEAELQKYIDEHAIVDIKAQIDLLQSEVTELVRERLRTERELTELEGALVKTKNQPDQLELLLQVPAITGNLLVENLHRQRAAQQKVLAEIAKRYKYKHPKYIAAQTNLATTEAQLAEVLQQIAAGLSQQVVTLKNRKAGIEFELAKVKAKLLELGKQQMQLTRLSREVEANRNSFETFSASLRETEMIKDMEDTEQFAVVDQATVPKFPSKPNVTMTLLMAGIACGVLSAGFWLVLHLMSDKQSRLIQILNQHRVPILARLPKEGKQDKRRAAVPIRSQRGETSHPYAEQIRALRTSLSFSADARLGRIIAVTAVGEGHGKDSVAINLAESFSNIEPTLLADVDLARPSVANAFELTEQHPGISDLIKEDTAFTRCLHYENTGRLAVLPAGKATPDPGAILALKQFRSFIRKMAGMYKRIVFTTPPVTSVSDALLLSKISTGIVLVCDVEKTPPELLSDTLAIFKETNAPVLGVVLNKVKGVKRGPLA